MFLHIFNSNKVLEYNSHKKRFSIQRIRAFGEMPQFVLFAVLSCFLSVVGLCEVFMIHPKELCHADSGELDDCVTWKEYAEKHFFNQSNVEWRFAEGIHTIHGGPFHFDNIVNVSFTCAGRWCHVVCVGPGNCVFNFSQVTNVTISSLSFEYNADTVTFPQLSLLQCTTAKSLIPSFYSQYHPISDDCLANRTWIFTNSTDITVSGVDFIGPQNSWAVVRPRGRFTISNCSFTNLSSGLSEYDPLNTSTGQHHIAVIVEAPQDPSSPPLVFTVENTTFEGHYLPSLCRNARNYPVILLISEAPLNGWPVNFTIRKCNFIKCPVLQVVARQDPRLHIVLEASKIHGYIDKTTALYWLKNCTADVTFSAIRVCLDNSVSGGHLGALSLGESLLGTFKISSNWFRQLGSGVGSAIYVNLKTVRHLRHAMQVILLNNTFRDNHGFHHKNLVSIRHDIEEIDQHNNSSLSVDQSASGFSYPLRVEFNTFKYNFQASKIDYHCVILSRLRSTYIIIKADVRDNDVNYQHRLVCSRLGVVYLSGLSDGYRVQFRDNTIHRNKATGLTLYSSHVEMLGTNIVRYNLGYYGAGIRMNAESLLLLRNDTSLEVVQNQAYFSGGGFYILDQCTLNISFTHCPCFFQLIHHNGSYISHLSKDELKVLVNVSDNRAFNKGKGSASVIFNSNIDQCYLETNVTGVTCNADILRKVFNITGQVDRLDISSIPRRICTCRDGKSLQDIQVLTYYPGQQLSVGILLEGDMGIPLSGVLYVDLVSEEYHNVTDEYFPPELHSTHVLLGECNNIMIPALPILPRFFLGTEFTLQLRVSLFTGTEVPVSGRYLYTTIKTSHLKGCPSGFYLKNISESHQSCQCSNRLKDAGIKCSLDTLSMVKPKKGQLWIGEYNGDIQWSRNCPRVRCNVSVHVVSINGTDIQCLYKRKGILCGRCSEGLSVVLGANECDKCTHWSLLFLLLVLIGSPLLVVLIGALNMTITVGAINGFLFYITIVAINGDDFEPLVHPGSFHVCLYDGMTEFGKTLFYFFFPLYLLLLVGIACLLPKCKCINMHKINKAIGPRITPVLATVITVSYVVIATTTIKSLSFGIVHSTDGSRKVVWLFDGSLEYFQSPQHIVLGVMAIAMLLFFLLPAAVVATFGDLLRRFIKGPYYMNFLDTFHGAFRFRFGFWFGVRLLILTMIMTFKFTLSVTKPTKTNLAIVYTSIFILVFQIVFQPYRGIRIKDCVTESIKAKYFSDRVQQYIANSLDNTFQINIIALHSYGASVHRGDGLYINHLSAVVAVTELVLIFIYHLLEYTPLGQILIEQMRRTKRKYNRWKEARLLRARKEKNKLEEIPIERVDFELRLEDCWVNDSDEAVGGNSCCDGNIDNYGDDDQQCVDCDCFHCKDKNAGGQVVAVSGCDMDDARQDLLSPLLMKHLS
jgi:hypothetical protein